MKIIDFIKRNWLYFALAVVLVIAFATIFSTPASLKNNPSKNITNEPEKTSAQPIVVYGDTRSGHAVHQKIVDAIIKFNPSAVFHTGDLVNNEKWYEVDISGVHFIILDSELSLKVDSEQYNWLVEDLKTKKANDLIVAIFHQPVFSSGPHGGSAEYQNTLVPLFEKYGIDLVFSGHDHDYERSQYHNIYYIVAGGGGAPLYDKKSPNPASQKFIKSYNFCVLQIENQQIKVDVYNQDSTLIDEFTTQ
jgi:predicted phosphodiesterase